MDRSNLLIRPRAVMLLMRTCRRKKELNGEGEDAILMFKANVQPRSHRVEGVKRLLKGSSSALKSSGDHTRMKGDPRGDGVSRKRV